MSRPVTRSSSRESAVPPTVDLLAQEEENQHEQELSEFDESIQSEFEDEDDTDFDKWADEEENQSSASLTSAPNKFKAPPKWLIEDKKWKELTVP
jgi:hypothetical protein